MKCMFMPSVASGDRERLATVIVRTLILPRGTWLILPPFDATFQEGQEGKRQPRACKSAFDDVEEAATVVYTSE